MRSMIVFLSLFFFSFVDAAPLPKEFTALLARAKMTFKIPAEMVSVAPKENRAMNYDVAYKHKKEKFEVRFAVRPLDDYFKDYEAKKNDKNMVMIPPNNLYPSFFQVTALNIGISVDLEKAVLFPPEAVKKEFRADWGATITVTANKVFGGGYTWCCLVMIHKNDCGEGYIFFMADDKEVLTREMEKVFDQLKFK